MNTSDFGGELKVDESHSCAAASSAPSAKEARYRRRQLKTNLREIFGAARFSTFSTVSTWADIR
jgi:hypothetical protein